MDATAYADAAEKDAAPDPIDAAFPDAADPIDAAAPVDTGVPLGELCFSESSIPTSWVRTTISSHPGTARTASAPITRPSRTWSASCSWATPSRWARRRRHTRSTIAPLLADLLTTQFTLDPPSDLWKRSSTARRHLRNAGLGRLLELRQVGRAHRRSDRRQHAGRRLLPGGRAQQAHAGDHDHRRQRHRRDHQGGRTVGRTRPTLKWSR